MTSNALQGGRRPEVKIVEVEGGPLALGTIVMF
jgi:hypothetical protein